MINPGSQFLQAVHRLLPTCQNNWDKAWQTAQKLHPDIYAAMASPPGLNSAQPKQSVEFLNHRAAKRQAAAAFVKIVHEHMDKTGSDYTQSWDSCQRLHRAEYAKMANP